MHSFISSRIRSSLASFYRFIAHLLCSWFVLSHILLFVHSYKDNYDINWFLRPTIGTHFAIVRSIHFTNHLQAEAKKIQLICMKVCANVQTLNSIFTYNSTVPVCNVHVLWISLPWRGNGSSQKGHDIVTGRKSESILTSIYVEAIAS